jgi:hypothetical protein
MRYSRAGSFTEIRPVLVGDLGTGKQIFISQVESLFEGFCYQYLIKRMISMHLITQKISR